MAQAAVHRAQEASLRLAQILDTNRPAATRIWKPALGMLASFSVVCLALLPQAPAVSRRLIAAAWDHSDPRRAICRPNPSPGEPTQG